MRIYILAGCWAIAMLILATLARADLVERDTADLLLLVMPMIAVTTLLQRGTCIRPACGS